MLNQNGSIAGLIAGTMLAIASLFQLFGSSFFQFASDLHGSLEIAAPLTLFLLGAVYVLGETGVVEVKV